jgi:hypothetical protein
MFVLSRFASRIAELVFSPAAATSIFPPRPASANAVEVPVLTTSSVFVLFLRKSLRAVAVSAASGAVNAWFTAPSNCKVFERISNAEFVSIVLDHVLSSTAGSSDIWVRLEIVERAKELLDARLHAKAAVIITAASAEDKARNSEDQRLWRECVQAYEWLSILCTLQDIAWLRASAYWAALEQTKGKPLAVLEVLLDLLDDCHALQLNIQVMTCMRLLFAASRAVVLTCCCVQRLESVLTVLEEERRNHADQYAKFMPASSDKKAGADAKSGAISWTSESLLLQAVSRNVQACLSVEPRETRPRTNPFFALHSIIYCFAPSIAPQLTATLLKASSTPLLSGSTASAADIPAASASTSTAASPAPSLPDLLNRIALLNVLWDCERRLSPRLPVQVLSTPKAVPFVALFLRHTPAPNSALLSLASLSAAEYTNAYLYTRRPRPASTPSSLASTDSKVPATRQHARSSSSSLSASPMKPVLLATAMSALGDSSVQRRQRLELYQAQALLLAYSASNALPAAEELVSAERRVKFLASLTSASATNSLECAGALLSLWCESHLMQPAQGASKSPDILGTTTPDGLKQVATTTIDTLIQALASASASDSKSDASCAAAQRLLEFAYSRAVVQLLPKPYQETVYARVKALAPRSTLPYKLGTCALI